MNCLRICMFCRPSGCVMIVIIQDTLIYLHSISSGQMLTWFTGISVSATWSLSPLSAADDNLSCVIHFASAILHLAVALETLTLLEPVCGVFHVLADTSQQFQKAVNAAAEDFTSFSPRTFPKITPLASIGLL